MSNRRIQQKYRKASRPLRMIEISVDEAQRRLDRLLQRMKRHHEGYWLIGPEGQRVAMVPTRWLHIQEALISRRTRRAAMAAPLSHRPLGRDYALPSATRPAG